MLRPDVVILVNRLALVIEGKFFHDSYSVNDARMQLAAQRQVIKDIILNFPGYDLERYAQIFLAEQTLTTAEDLGCQGVITWTDIGKLSSKLLGTEHYVTQRFTRAVTLYHALRGVHTSQGSSGIKNYRSKFSFTGILRKCEDEGDQILVGFQGGLSKLWVSDVEHLRKRNYKWDLSSDPIPPKRSENWISGSAFLNTLKQKMGEDYEEGPRTETIIEARGRTIGSNYRGKLSFSGMINKCNKHGAKVLVGFNGGYSGLRDAKKSYLTNREYKWDWTEAPILPKKMSNWIAGDRFLGVVFEKVPSARSID